MSCKPWGPGARAWWVLAAASLTVLASCTTPRPANWAAGADPDHEESDEPADDDAWQAPRWAPAEHDPADDAPGDHEAGEPRDPVPGRTSGRPGAFEPPPTGVPWDYQIGKASPPLGPVRVISRDRLMPPVASTPGKPMYNICYVNGFQGQPDDPGRVGPPPEGSDAWWEAEHGDLVRRRGGEIVKDTKWNEDILDITTADKRAKVAAVVGRWIDGCADAGFQGVEIDNLDAYERTGGTEQEQQQEKPYAVAYMRLLADRAHARGLAIGQKNAVELVPQRTQMGTDFAVVEECNAFDECDRFAGDAGYGDRVYIVEYDPASFAKGCREWPKLSVVLRDEQVSTTTALTDLCLPTDQ